VNAKLSAVADKLKALKTYPDDKRHLCDEAYQ